MHYRTSLFPAVALYAGLAAPIACAQLLEPAPACTIACEHEADQFTDLLTAELERQLFSMLPRDHQAAILIASPSAVCERLPDDAEPADVRYEHVRGYISQAGYEGMPVGRRFMLASSVRRAIDGMPPMALCFEPGSVTEEEAWAFSLALFGDNARFQQTGRWTSTAYSGGGLSQGTPTIISYSFPPDGTFIPNIGVGVGSGPNTLNAWLNGIYGNSSVWLPHFHGVFDRWAQLTGLSYVYEPNDDGVNMNQNAGVQGVRGDVRIGAFDFQNDGNGGVLAYNNFPQDGDMVFDAFDTFYNNTGSNSLRLRNVISHEHGHGLGMLHVCPANGTKLMEPFVSTAYVGPQIDDILNGQRHYGDPYEHNDTIATATNIGTPPAFGTLIQNISIDDNSDIDYFAVQANVPAQLFVLITPRGGEYQQGTQTQACNTGTLTNYNNIHNLSLQIIASDGTTVLANVNDNPAGGSETATVLVSTPGTYYVRVAGDNTNSIQLYDISINLLPAPPLLLTIPNGTPDLVAPGVSASFDVQITSVSQTVASAQLFTRVNGGSYQATNLTDLGGGAYLAQLPAFNCDDQPEFYVQATGSGGFVVTAPDNGATNPLGLFVGVVDLVFNDNGETNPGWTVSGSVTDGAWERGVPVGGGTRGDPPTDADGSGACWLTANRAGDSDIDNGCTVLTSPVLDASNPEAVLSYWRWFSNNFGANPNQDTMTVEVSSNNGSTWTTLEIVGPATAESGGGWFYKSFRVADFVASTNQFRVRFIACDNGGGSVVEAGVDGISLAATTCEQDDCPADFNGDGEVDFFDVQAFLGAFTAQQPAADLNGDLAFDFFDVQIFLGIFAAGCP